MEETISKANNCQVDVFTRNTGDLDKTLNIFGQCFRVIGTHQHSQFTRSKGVGSKRMQQKAQTPCREITCLQV
ncbi:hypothetical protein FQZ97_704010 [compost metagenome]